MNARQPFSMYRKCFVLAALLLTTAVLIRTPRGTAAEGTNQEESVSQAQAAMSSLFGSKGTLPVPPRVEGTIALPSFDSKDLRVDEEQIREKNGSGKK